MSRNSTANRTTRESRQRRGWCKGLTKSGKPCRAGIVEGTEYCWFHSGSPGEKRRRAQEARRIRQEKRAARLAQLQRERLGVAEPAVLEPKPEPTPVAVEVDPVEQRAEDFSRRHLEAVDRLNRARRRLLELYAAGRIPLSALPGELQLEVTRTPDPWRATA